jgi:outer membrane protein assembly factor BamD (BamD/ComL family)
MGTRELLKQGDTLLRDGEPASAVDHYARAAREYADAGFGLKAVAIWKQVREIVRTHLPNARALDAEARAALVTLYRSLGLESDAREVEAENETDGRYS